MNSAGVADLAHRQDLARRGRQLEVMTIVWGVAEASLALYAARRAGSVSLAGFGFDSVIEVTSALALLWRMSHEMDHQRRHQAEKLSLTIAGWCLIVLAIYVLLQASYSLWSRHEAETGMIGIAVTLAALLAMPLLARAKRRVARGLNSSAMMTDATQTDFCMYQAAIVLFGLLLYRLFGIAWADGAAALLLVPLLVRAGVLALRGVSCCSH